jgi:hypothetical protein
MNDLSLSFKRTSPPALSTEDLPRLQEPFYLTLESDPTIEWLQQMHFFFTSASPESREELGKLLLSLPDDPRIQRILDLVKSIDPSLKISMPFQTALHRASKEAIVQLAPFHIRIDSPFVRVESPAFMVASPSEETSFQTIEEDLR